jgi:DNA-binding NarL/FixJ family response regulator
MSILKNTRYRLGCTDNVEPADHKLRESDVLLRRVLSEASRELQTVIYLDPRAFTRHCVGWWLQSSLRGFHVSILPDPKQIVIATNINHIRAVIINAGPAPSSSPSVVRSISRVTQLLPDVPIILLSNHEDAENIQKAFEIGVRGYVPTSLPSLVAIEAVRLVCAGGPSPRPPSWCRLCALARPRAARL